MRNSSSSRPIYFLEYSNVRIPKALTSISRLCGFHLKMYGLLPSRSTLLSYSFPDTRPVCCRLCLLPSSPSLLPLIILIQSYSNHQTIPSFSFCSLNYISNTLHLCSTLNSVTQQRWLPKAIPKNGLTEPQTYQTKTTMMESSTYWMKLKKQTFSRERFGMKSTLLILTSISDESNT